MTELDIVALKQLGYRYADTIDASDLERFLAVFTTDARLRIYHPDAQEPFADLPGREERHDGVEPLEHVAAAGPPVKNHILSEHLRKQARVVMVDRVMTKRL